MELVWKRFTGFGWLNSRMDDMIERSRTVIRHEQADSAVLAWDSCTRSNQDRAVALSEGNPQSGSRGAVRDGFRARSASTEVKRAF